MFPSSWTLNEVGFYSCPCGSRSSVLFVQQKLQPDHGGGTTQSEGDCDVCMGSGSGSGVGDLFSGV